MLVHQEESFRDILKSNNNNNKIVKSEKGKSSKVLLLRLKIFNHFSVATIFVQARKLLEGM